MEVTVSLVDIIDSYQSYLKGKLGKEFTQLEAFTVETDGKGGFKEVSFLPPGNTLIRFK